MSVCDYDTYSMNKYTILSAWVMVNPWFGLGHYYFATVY